MNLKVLVADDDEIVISIHTTYLKKSGLSLNPLSFSNGKEVLEYILNHQDNETRYLIFLDINMPVLSGWEFMDEVNNQAFAERIYIVLVTSSINKTDKEKASKYKNAIDFLEKPINMQDCMRIKSLPQISACFNG